MPNYTFKCQKCGEFTINRGINVILPDKCPTCDSEIVRVYKSGITPIWKCEGSFNARVHE